MPADPLISISGIEKENRGVCYMEGVTVDYSIPEFGSTFSLVSLVT